MADEVLVVTPTFYPESVGTPLYVTDLVRGLLEHGTPCRVVTGQPYYPAFRRFPGYGRRTRADDVEGIPVVRMPTVVPRRGAAAWRAISEVNFLLQVLVRIAIGRLRRAPTVLAVSPGVPVAVLAGAALRRRGGRLVAVVHDVQFGLVRTTGGPVARRLARAARHFEVRALQRADAVTVLSPATRDALVDAGVTVPLHVVPLWPTVETDEFEADPDTVLYSGNLGRKQGVGVLLDVAEGLGVAAPRARLVIRGEGPEGGSLRAEASRRGLGNVVFEPLVPAEELAHALARAAVHIVPQLPEGAAFAVPSKIFNILAAGRPVVATAAPTSTVGLLASEVDAVRTVPPGDVEALVAEIAALLADTSDRRRVGEAGKRWVYQTHGRDRALRAYLQLLDHEPRGPGQPRISGGSGRGS